MNKPAWIAALVLVLGCSMATAGGSWGEEPDTSAELALISKRMDDLIETQVLEEGRKPRPLAHDFVYLRRVYLTTIGRIPTLDEIQAFVRSDEPDKKANLVDELLDSPGYVSHMFNYFADLLRIKTRLARQTSGEPYAHWVRASLEENKPYDVFVKEALTAEGAAHARGNGATGYYLRDRGMPEDNMANTMRVFLGTRLECAQCHNHPFDVWTRKQFFEMAAFTEGMEFTAIPRRQVDFRERRQIVGEISEKYGRQVIGDLRRYLNPVDTGISGGGTGLIRLPKDYAYDDAKPRQTIKVEPLFGPEVHLPVEWPSNPPRNRGRRARNRQQNSTFQDIDSRESYGQWVTSPENPRFTKVIANRMWKKVMGVGLIEPVDDIRDDTKASNPELMHSLEETMRLLDYDLKSFLRVLLNTQAFQREASAIEPEAGVPFVFDGPVMMRMSAEQIWDSMLTLVVEDLDDTLALDDRAEEVYTRYESRADMTKEALFEVAESFSLRYSDPEAFRRARRELEMAERRERAADKTVDRSYVRSLLSSMRRAQRRGDAAGVEKAKEALMVAGYDPDARAKRRQRDLKRASDLTSPAPDGHFLRDFGQSDRDQIEASHRDPSIPQVLSLLNGFLEDHILNDSFAIITRNLSAAHSTEEKIDRAFLCILSRMPSDQERALWRSDFTKDNDQATLDLMWTLVNTHEFLFIR